MLVVMLGAQTVIGALNELADRDIDRTTKPDKPLPRGRATERGPLKLLSSGLLLLALGSTPRDPVSFLLAFLGCAIGASYSLWCKRTIFAWLPYMLALPLLPIWIPVAVDEFRLELLTTDPIGLLAIGGVQITRSIGDIEADRRVGIRSLTTKLGQKRSMRPCWSTTAIPSLALTIAGWEESFVTGASVTVLLGLLGNALLYWTLPLVALRTIFPHAAGGVVFLGLAWVYAIGT